MPGLHALARGKTTSAQLRPHLGTDRLQPRYPALRLDFLAVVGGPTCSSARCDRRSTNQLRTSYLSAKCSPGPVLTTASCRCQELHRNFSSRRSWDIARGRRFVVVVGDHEGQLVHGDVRPNAPGTAILHGAYLSVPAPRASGSSIVLYERQTSPEVPVGDVFHSVCQGVVRT